MKVRVFEAFSGYGSTAMAMKKLQKDYPDKIDFEFVGISEIENNAVKAYKAVHGEVKNYGDISKINWSDVPNFDLLTYSFPCQDISMAGKQNGFSQDSGTRSSLLWECRKAIKAKRPRFLLLENVKALVSDKFKPDFRRWIYELEKFGYSNYWQVLDASGFGLPQHRERVFMVSILGNTEPYYFPQPFPLEKRLKDVLEDEVDEKYYLSGERVQGMLKSTEKESDKGNGFKFEPADVNGVAHTVQTTQNRKTDNFLKVLNPLKGKTDKSWFFEQQVYDENGIARAIKSESGSGNVPKVVQVGQIYPNTGNPQAGRIYSEEGVSPTLDTMEGGNRQPKIVTCASRKRGDGHNLEFGGDVANCVTGVNTDSMVAEPFNVCKDGTCRTIKAQYYKNSLANFVREDGLGATCVIEPKIMKVGNYSKSGHNASAILDPNGISPTIMENHGTVNAVIEPKIILENETQVSQEKRIYNTDGISCTIDTYCNARPKIAVKENPKVINVGKVEYDDHSRTHQQDFVQHEDGLCRTIPAGTHGSTPHLLKTMVRTKDGVMYKGREIKDGDGLYACYSESFFRGGLDGVSRSLKAEMHDAAVCTNYRIRRLTPTECGRLMGCSDEDIKKMIDAGISNSALYRLFGNSIATNCLYHIFRKLFIDTKPENHRQLSLF